MLHFSDKHKRQAIYRHADLAFDGEPDCVLGPVKDKALRVALARDP
jgi:hypothetical protein